LSLLLKHLGDPLPPYTLELIDHPETRAIFLGAVGGPEWDNCSAASKRPEQALLKLRQHLQCYANLRPLSFPSNSLVKCSPLSERTLCSGPLPDFIVLRELCGGIYFGSKTDTGDFASDEERYSVDEVERIARVAGYLAIQMARERGWSVARVSSVDKANVLASSRLWRRTVASVFAKEFPKVELNHFYVDAAAMHMVILLFIFIPGLS
jgi:3-isopropylmalate dehydrogenase